MPTKEEQTRPYPHSFTITDLNGNLVKDTSCVLINQTNNGTTKEKTNLRGVTIFSYDNFSRAETGVSSPYNNGEKITLVVGGTESHVHLRAGG